MRKAVSESRDLLQSRLLVALAGGAILLCLVWLGFLAIDGSVDRATTVEAAMLSLTFAGLVWALRAGTFAAALWGATICFELTLSSVGASLLRSELTPLILLFALTFLATRTSKRRRPLLTSDRENRHGRTASQVIANLGAAPLILIVGVAGSHCFELSGANGMRGECSRIVLVLALAALVEATADTVSSELGQAFGGTPYLLTTWKPVAPGTDGAVSLLGSLAGILAGALVAGAGAWAMRLPGSQAIVALFGGVGGLLFDSLLGATAERRGWLNNDLVNFCSTIFAAVAALVLLWFGGI